MKYFKDNLSNEIDLEIISYLYNEIDFEIMSIWKLSKLF